ncbi:hypothetical protein ABMA27_010972 [Loxostege sticticalis]|uniref:Androgen-dependent TFPI-regulating protein n=1 Tax=Loxostege sticticalis TaxID=481309 RepID=A0ABR3H3K5_LOXSC
METSNNHIYYRIAGHTIMLIIFIRNTIAVNMAMNEHLPTHPELQVFHDLGPRYATVWNIIIQMTYAFLALACDLSEVLNKDSLVPVELRRFRYTLFTGLLYPLGVGIAFVFWPHYIYDRELVFPKKVDIIMPFFENFAAHGLVSIYALYELAFIPRDSIKNEKTYHYGVWFNVIYMVVLHYTRYIDLGIWAYEVFNVLEGSVYFYLLMVYPAICSTFFYTTLWWTQEAVWKLRDLQSSDSSSASESFMEGLLAKKC